MKNFSIRLALIILLVVQPSPASDVTCLVKGLSEEVLAPIPVSLRPHVVWSRYTTRLLKGVKPGDRDWKRVVEIIQFASEAMIRRGWSASFLQERITLAELFAAQSDYIEILANYGKRNGLRQGTFGITYANENEELAMEYSLKIKLPKSPLKIEARTYAMNKKTQLEVFPFIAEQIIERLNTALKIHPELMHQKIVYTYGDETSVELYGYMGFKVQKEFGEIEHEGTLWKILAISPADLIANHPKKMFSSYWLTYDQPRVHVLAPDGRHYWAEDHVFYLPRGKASFFSLAEKAEILPRVVASARSLIRWHENGQVAHIETLSKKSLVAPRLWAAAETSVDYYENRSIFRVAELARNYRIPKTPFTARKGFELQLDQEGKPLFIGRLAKSAEVLPGWNALAGTALRIQENGGLIEFHAAESKEIAPEVWTSVGSKVLIRLTGESPGVVHVAGIARDYVVNGRVVKKKGDSYSWYDAQK